MKKILAGVLLFALFGISIKAQGLVFFVGGTANATKTSTNSVAGGAATGLTAGSGAQYYFALYYSTNATSVNGQSAAIVGNANNNYAFSSSSWKLAAYGTNRSSAGRFGTSTTIGTGSSISSQGEIILPDVPGGSYAQFVVVAWSANIGTNIAAVQAWYDSGFPFRNGWIGQSAVSGSILLGDGGIIATPQVMSTVQGAIQGFVLGFVFGDTLYAPTYITSQPTNQTVSVGSTASFQARAYGDIGLSFSYQWRLNGTNISAGGNYSMSVSNFNDYYTHYADFNLTVTNAQLTNAGNYSVFVYNNFDSTTSSNALLTVTGGPGVSPGIVNQPTNVAALVGNNVSFAVTANGSAPLSYQWKYNGTNIANATNVSLPLLNVQLADAGNYSVTITNAYGATNSAAGILTVSPGTPPTITAQPLPQIVQAGNNATFTVGTSGSSPISYQWNFNGTNLTGKTNASLVLTAVQSNNVGSYGVAISNPYGATNSFIATLTVFPLSGYVIFAGNAAASTRIYTNSEVGGIPTGQTGGGGGKYLFALFASAAATNVNGQTTAILGSDNSNYAFNDTNWTLVAYGTNTSLAGRVASVSPDFSGQTPVAGLAGGTSAQFVVIGWSSSIGLNITAAKSWFNNGSVSSDGWIGQSAVSGAILLGDGGIIPPSAVFGSSVPRIPGFTLGLISPIIHRSYALNFSPLVLQSTLVGNSLKLSWPTSAGSYGVQSADNPSGPWNDTGLNVTTEGANSTATVQTAGQQKFFRLIVQ